MPKASTKKTVITNPDSKREIKINSAIYNPFKAAIVQSLKGSKARLPDGQGKTFTDLTDDVVKIIKKNFPEFKGSIPWYTISVLRDMEARGIVENFIEKGRKYNRLKK